MNTPSPGEVRRTILQQHEELRRALREVLLAPALAPILSFFDQLEAHLDTEDRLLAPALEHLDAWGPERSRKLREEHAAQRRVLKFIRSHLHDPYGLGPWMRRLGDRLLRDMEAEERERLSPDLLRDRPIAAAR
jgi:hypothetical protein